MQIQLSGDDLRPLVVEIVREVLAQIEVDRATFGDKLTYSEPEAASILGVAPHVLRDARQRREVVAKRIGKSYRYNKVELLRFAGIASDGRGRRGGAA